MCTDYSWRNAAYVNACPTLCVIRLNIVTSATQLSLSLDIIRMQKYPFSG